MVCRTKRGGGSSRFAALTHELASVRAGAALALVAFAILLAAAGASSASQHRAKRTAVTHSGARSRRPVNTVAPTISGSPTVGFTLSATTGSWSGTQPLQLSYQWKRCDAAGSSCVAISGATANSRTLSSSADIGSRLRVTVTAHNNAGNGSGTSAATPTIVAAPVTTAAATTTAATTTAATTTAATTTTASVTATTATTSTTPALPSSSGNPRFGFSWGATHLNYMSDAALAHEFDMMSAAGGHWIRIDINWAVIQAGGRTSYDWAPFDRVVQAAESRGMDVLGVLSSTPNWAKAAGATGPTPPANLNDYAAFARTAVAHYAPLGLHNWEIWNEPNGTWGWAPKPDPVAYTSMLKLAYSAIHQTDAGATVLGGALSTEGVDDGTNYRPVTFLASMYANGAAGSFDALSVHPYTFPYTPSTTGDWSSWQMMGATSPSERSLMIANGDGAKKIWATEYGAPTNGPAGGNFVSEAAQASLVTQAYQTFATYSWSGPMFWYAGQDYSTDTSTTENFYGLWRTDFSMKPSFAAYRTAALGQ
jgi:hypothetical protein